MDNFGRKTLSELFAADDRARKDFEHWELKKAQRASQKTVKKYAAVDERVVHKTVESQKTRGLDFILSDATPDRYDDIILTSGWVLENFNRNPIALFQHQSSFPIGKWRDVRVEDNALRGTLTLAPMGTSDRIDELHKLIDADILHAVSVGFTPIDYEERNGGYGLLYTRQELVECSLVSIPANPNALQVAKELRISPDTQEMVFSGRRRQQHLGDAAPTLDAATQKLWDAWLEARIDRYREATTKAYMDVLQTSLKSLAKEIDEVLEKQDGNVTRAMSKLRKEWRREIDLLITSRDLVLTGDQLRQRLNTLRDEA